MHAWHAGSGGPRRAGRKSGRVRLAFVGASNVSATVHQEDAGVNKYEVKSVVMQLLSSLW